MEWGRRERRKKKFFWSSFFKKSLFLVQNLEFTFLLRVKSRVGASPINKQSGKLGEWSEGLKISNFIQLKSLVDKESCKRVENTN